MGGIWSFFNPQEDVVSGQKQQQLIIKEIELIEACVYCYIDSQLETLLMPYATKSYPWDIQCDILPHFREKSDSKSRKCYHCLKGQLKDYFSCQIIDKIFQKKTQECQCEVLSAESSEISFGLFDDDDNVSDKSNDDDNGQVEHSSSSSLTDTEESEWSDMPSQFQ